MTTLIPKFDLKNGGSTPANAINRTIYEKLSDTISVKDFGAIGDGTTDDTAAIQAALNISGNIFIPSGTYKITASLTFGNNTNIVFDKNASFVAGVDNLTFFLVSTYAYFSQIRNATLNGNGHAGVVGFDLTNFRLQAGLYDCFCTNMTNGLIARSGCFAMEVLNFTTYSGVPNPIQILNNDSGIDIHNPNLNNESGTGANTGTGIYIDSGSGSNIGVVISGGYIQGFNIGIEDKSLAAKIENIYFEVCTTADIYFNGARNSTASGTNHYGSSGVVALKSRNSDAVTVLYPTMGSGARSTGVFDFDASNSDCVQYHTFSNAYLNVPLGITTGINSLPIQSYGTFTPVVIGSSTTGTATYTTQLGNFTQTGSVVNFNISLAWSGHTGTGNIAITGFPTSLIPALFTYGSVFHTAPLIPYTGPTVYSQFNGNSTQISLVQVSTAGSSTFVSLPSSGALLISGTYNINAA